MRTTFHNLFELYSEPPRLRGDQRQHGFGFQSIAKSGFTKNKNHDAIMIRWECDLRLGSRGRSVSWAYQVSTKLTVLSVGNGVDKHGCILIPFFLLQKPISSVHFDCADHLAVGHVHENSFGGVRKENAIWILYRSRSIKFFPPVGSAHREVPSRAGSMELAVALPAWEQ